jgi:hypothetical protein
MYVEEVSKEKGIIIRGLVKGKPIYAVVSPGDYIRHRLIFPIVLTEDIEVGFKKAKGEILKANSAIVVKCSKLCYVSVGDTIKVRGKIIRVKSEIWETSYMFIKANEIFNETQQTGILMY